MNKIEFLIDFSEHNHINGKIADKIAWNICLEVKDANERTHLLKRLMNNYPNVNILKRYYTDDLCYLVLKKTKNLNDIPISLYTPELCRQAVEIDGFNLAFVPDDIKTKELCEVAFKNNKIAIDFMPDEYKTEAMCMEAVSDCTCVCDVLVNGIPEKFYSKDLFLAAVKSNPYALNDIPEIHRSYEVCMESVKANGKNLCFVPKDVIDEKMCEIAMKNTASAYEYIPDEYITEEMCLKAVALDGKYLDFVPDRFQNKNLYETAYKNNKNFDFIDKIPYEYRTYEMCDEAVKQSGKNIRYVPSKFIDSNIATRALNTCKDQIEFNIVLDALPKNIQLEHKLDHHEISHNEQDVNWKHEMTTIRHDDINEDDDESPRLG